ncbi:MAG: hypothetical protein RL672_1328 [Actinomycetota bacterium]|mgnify:FL=1
MTEKLTRDEQREAARAKAREMRDQHRRGEKRKRLTIQLSIILGSLALVGVVVFALVNGANSPQPNDMKPVSYSYDDGIKLGVGGAPFTATSTPTASATPGAKAPVNIKIYVDYQCPICQGFELANGDQIKSWLDSGYATLELHPLSFLDGQGSPNEYSSRAANASICVAENSPGEFWAYNKKLWQNQPQELTPGPENSELFKTAQNVGVTNADKIQTCINNKSYGKWVASATSTVLTADYVVPGSKVPVKGTPTIVIGDQQYTGELTNPARFAQWVKQVSGN